MKTSPFIFASLFFLVGLATPLLAHAADSDFRSCPDDYYGFILDVRSENTRQRGIKDFFTLGYCQLNDIIVLNEELQDLRDNFRAAAFECADTRSYKAEYQRILLEQYFIRNIQKAKSGAIRNVDAEEFDRLKTQRLDLLHAQMVELFVNQENRVNKSTFEGYFNSWVEKYDDRIGDYSQCEEGTWSQVNETWEDFVDTIEDLSIDVENPGLNFNNNISIDNDLDQAANSFEESVKPVLDAWEYLNSLREQGEAEIDVPSSVKDLAESGQSYNIYDVFDVLGRDEQRYLIALHSEDRMARYKLLYGEGGAVASSNMEGIVGELNRVLSQSNAKDFPNILAGLSSIYDKQCN